VGLSEREIAARAGVDAAYVGVLVRVGLLTPSSDGTFTEGDARRARVYQGLERAGLPIETIAEALDRGALSFEFLDRPLYDRFAGLSPRSFREVSEREGIPIGLLLVVRDAIGFAHAEPDEPMREDELRIVPLVGLQLANGFDPAVIERWLRVYGLALRRIAETEANWWYTQVALPMLASGLSSAEVLERTQERGEVFARLTEEALLAVYHAHQEHTWTESLIEEVESALDRAGLRAEMRATPAICFVDISGFTDLTEQRGDEAAADLAERLAAPVSLPAERRGGKVVKWLGDGVMLHFRRAEDAVPAALEILEAVADAGLPPAHIGIHSGPVVFQGGDYFGRTVNLAARIADHAEPGRILVSDDVATAAGGNRSVAVTPVGAVALKGIAEPVLLHIVERGEPLVQP
jgi:class 3 adenylate cyclase